MLKVLDGQVCRLDAKYSRLFIKKVNVPVVMIANSIIPMAKEWGPMQERFLRLRFVTCIDRLSEERVVATLAGCIKRRREEAEKNVDS